MRSNSKLFGFICHVEIYVKLSQLNIVLHKERSGMILGLHHNTQFSVKEQSILLLEGEKKNTHRDKLQCGSILVCCPYRHLST